MTSCQSRIMKNPHHPTPRLPQRLSLLPQRELLVLLRGLKDSESFTYDWVTEENNNDQVEIPVTLKNVDQKS